jgi:hypothetical protein
MNRRKKIISELNKIPASFKSDEEANDRHGRVGRIVKRVHGLCRRGKVLLSSMLLIALVLIALAFAHTQATHYLLRNFTEVHKIMGHFVIVGLSKLRQRCHKLSYSLFISKQINKIIQQ